MIGATFGVAALYLLLFIIKRMAAEFNFTARRKHSLSIASLGRSILLFGFSIHLIALLLRHLEKEIT
jgi:ammonia channel protein AmtB